MRQLLLLLLTTLSVTAAIKTPDVVASSGSWTDVSNALYTAKDTRNALVAIPTGSNNFVGTLVVTNDATLLGGWNGSAFLAGTNKDGTIFSGTGTFIFQFDPTENRTNRISNCRFEAFGIALSLRGINTDNRKTRVDHCLFTNYSAWPIDNETCMGVVDHNSHWGNTEVFGSYNYGRLWGGGTLGDESHADTNLFGSEWFTFYEDNFYTNSFAVHRTLFDGYGGSRYCIRHNRIGNGVCEIHGRESNRYGGGRACEIYFNEFAGNNTGGNVLFWRSGVGLVYSNNVRGYLDSAGVLNILYLTDSAAVVPFGAGNTEVGGADGINPWNTNYSGGPFGNGTATAQGSQKANNAIFVTNTSAPWTTDQWVGRSIVRTSGLTISSMSHSAGIVTANTSAAHGFSSGWKIMVRGATEEQYNTLATCTVVDTDTFTFPLDFGTTPATPATGSPYCFRGSHFSMILSNTTSVIAYKTSPQTTDTGNNFYDLNFTNGTTFDFYRVAYGMQQPGRIMGSLISGWPPSRPAGWDNEVSFPWYQWGNTRESGGLAFNPDSSLIVAGEHYTNDTVYSYTPYTYPHPLISATDALIEAEAGTASPRLGRIRGIRLQ